jgi:hypothetical protein
MVSLFIFLVLHFKGVKLTSVAILLGILMCNFSCSCLKSYAAEECEVAWLLLALRPFAIVDEAEIDEDSSWIRFEL